MSSESTPRPTIVDVDVRAAVVRTTRPRVAPIRLRALAYLTLIVLSALTLLPLVWCVASSFTPLDAILKYAVPFSWRALIPADFTWQAYQDLMASPFFGALLNTFFVCAVTVIAGIAVNSLAGFAFAVFEFPGKRILFIIVLITFMVPFEVMALPLYVIVNLLHMDNSYQALILPALANGIVIFLFRQFFYDTPRELLDAARVDGLSWFGIYGRIVVPLSTPVMVSAALVLFLSQWQSFFWPLLVANSPQYQMVQVALANFQGEHITLWNDLFAGSVIATVVPMTLMLVLQRYYVRTIARTGLID
jgi:multiple sugar transport system permease protein/putative chitobiose transport system permease protein